MPYSGKGTQEEIEQRQEAARTHGVFAIKERGQSAMTEGQRSRRTELEEQISTRQGAIDALRDQVVNTMMLAEVAQDYCIEQHKAGVALGDIPLLAKLPAFWNSANRALKVYLDTLPDDRDILDIGETIAKAVKEHEESN